MLNILPNQTFTLSPAVEARDSGWEISGQLATHYPCNAGTMYSKGTQGLIVGKSYVVTYEVVSFISGTVKVLLGNTSGTVRTAAGIYTETIECTGTAQISFFSDGYLTINKNLSFYELVEEVDNSITLAFSDVEGKQKKWSTHYSWQPEMMVGFISSFFSIKNGALWRHNVNELRNNFYGVQYTSKVKFYDNFNATIIKLYYSIRVTATSRWYCPNNGDIKIAPVLGRGDGMSSRLKKNNFQNYQGSFFADFLRNYLDARFNDPEKALFSGEPLRGRIMEITLTNADTNEAVLFEIDIKSSSSAITY